MKANNPNIKLSDGDRIRQLLKEQAAYVAGDRTKKDPLLFKVWIAGVALCLSIVAPLGYVLSDAELTKQYDANGVHIVNLEKHTAAGVDVCDTPTFAIYRDGKPIKCPTP